MAEEGIWGPNRASEPKPHPLTAKISLGSYAVLCDFWVEKMRRQKEEDQQLPIHGGRCRSPFRALQLPSQDWHWLPEGQEQVLVRRCERVMVGISAGCQVGEWLLWAEAVTVGTQILQTRWVLLSRLTNHPDLPMIGEFPRSWDFQC